MVHLPALLSQASWHDDQVSGRPTTTSSLLRWTIPTRLSVSIMRVWPRKLVSKIPGLLELDLWWDERKGPRNHEVFKRATILPSPFQMLFLRIGLRHAEI